MLLSSCPFYSICHHVSNVVRTRGNERSGYNSAVPIALNYGHWPIKYQMSDRLQPARTKCPIQPSSSGQMSDSALTMRTIARLNIWIKGNSSITKHMDINHDISDFETETVESGKRVSRNCEGTVTLRFRPTV